MKLQLIKITFVLSPLLLLAACTSESDNDTLANSIVACNMESVNQCVEWINLSEAMVPSLESTCVNDDGGVVIEACATTNLIGICEILDKPSPDWLGYFYLSPNTSDPVAYTAAKAQDCSTAGGVWVPQ